MTTQAARGEHVGPPREGFVRREHRQGEIPAGDDLEEEVGIDDGETRGETKRLVLRKGIHPR